MAVVLSFTAAYFVLRNQAVTQGPRVPVPKSTEQVFTTNVRTRMHHAIGSGAEIGVSEAQMAHMPRHADAEVVAEGPRLAPTAPPNLLVGINHAETARTPLDAPGKPSLVLHVNDAHAKNHHIADKSLRAERALRLHHNKPSTVHARHTRTRDLEKITLPSVDIKVPTRTVAQAKAIIDHLPMEALLLDANHRMQQMINISDEPGDSVQLAALAQQTVSL